MEFDRQVEALCQKFYDDAMGRASIPPGVYFRMLLIGYFEGIDSERGIAWRVADSFSLRWFLGCDLQTPRRTTRRSRGFAIGWMPIRTRRCSGWSCWPCRRRD